MSRLNEQEHIDWTTLGRLLIRRLGCPKELRGRFPSGCAPGVRIPSSDRTSLSGSPNGSTLSMASGSSGLATGEPPQILLLLLCYSTRDYRQDWVLRAGLSTRPELPIRTRAHRLDVRDPTTDQKVGDSSSSERADQGLCRVKIQFW